jgi:hypothetical protein
MKKPITLLFMTVGLCTLNAQVTETFETFTLAPSTAYSSTASLSFQNAHAEFQHQWNNSFNSWSGGFSYTNKYDSSTAGYNNLYGVKAYKGKNNSDIYVVGNDKAIVKLKNTQTIVSGFYITNTTYAYKSMQSGDQFAKKFGGASGNDPDYFKMVIKGFKGGLVKNDSVEFYLADFRFSDNSKDYILDSWEYVNTGIIGEVDSLQYFLRSSDVGTFGMNTPAFFAIDDFTTTQINTVGLSSLTTKGFITVWPNPFNGNIQLRNEKSADYSIKVYDANGRVIRNLMVDQQHLELDLSELRSGIYYLETISEGVKALTKIIRN